MPARVPTDRKRAWWQHPVVILHRTQAGSETPAFDPATQPERPGAGLDERARCQWTRDGSHELPCAGMARGRTIRNGDTRLIDQGGWDGYRNRLEGAVSFLRLGRGAKN